MPAYIDDFLERMFTPRTPPRYQADTGLMPTSPPMSSFGNSDDGGMGMFVPPRPPNAGPGVPPGANAPFVGTTPNAPRAGLFSTQGGGMPPMAPSQGMPGGLGSTSAGIFDAYMRQNMVKKGPTFMPPSFANVGQPAVGPAVPGLGGDPIMGGDGGGMGDGGGTSVGTDGGGFGGVPGANPGFSPAIGGFIGGLLAGTPGSLAARGLVGAYNSYNDQQNALAQATAREAEMMDAAAVDAAYGGLLGLTGPQGYTDLGGYGDASVGNGTDGGAADGSGQGTGDSAGSSSDSGGGSDSDGGDGWAKGGWVTKSRLRGKNPKGPDDGYGALDAGELVVPKNVAKRLSKRQVSGLLGSR